MAWHVTRRPVLVRCGCPDGVEFIVDYAGPVQAVIGELPPGSRTARPRFRCPHGVRGYVSTDGRRCRECGGPLSRYTDGPTCNLCHQEASDEWVRRLRPEVTA